MHIFDGTNIGRHNKRKNILVKPFTMVSGNKQDISKKNWDRNKKRGKTQKCRKMEQHMYLQHSCLPPLQKKISHLYSLFCLKLDDYVGYVRDVGKYCWCIQWVSIILPRKKKHMPNKTKD